MTQKLPVKLSQLSFRIDAPVKGSAEQRKSSWLRNYTKGGERLVSGAANISRITWKRPLVRARQHWRRDIARKNSSDLCGAWSLSFTYLGGLRGGGSVRLPAKAKALALR